MKTCLSIRKKLSAYQDGEVGSAQKDAIETHLNACEDCRRQYEAWQQTYRMLKSLPEIKYEARLSRRILARVTQTQEPFWVRIKGNAFRLLPAPAAMAALCAAGILFGTVVGNYWTEKQFFLTRATSAFRSDQALTLASVKAFNATPPGSFAEGYLDAAYNPEISHAK